MQQFDLAVVGAESSKEGDFEATAEVAERARKMGINMFDALQRAESAAGTGD